MTARILLSDIVTHIAPASASGNPAAFAARAHEVARVASAFRRRTMRYHGLYGNGSLHDAILRLIQSGEMDCPDWNYDLRQESTLRALATVCLYHADRIAAHKARRGIRRAGRAMPADSPQRYIKQEGGPEECPQKS